MELEKKRRGINDSSFSSVEFDPAGVFQGILQPLSQLFPEEAARDSPLEAEREEDEDRRATAHRLIGTEPYSLAASVPLDHLAPETWPLTTKYWRWLRKRGWLLWPSVPPIGNFILPEHFVAGLVPFPLLVFFDTITFTRSTQLASNVYVRLALLISLPFPPILLICLWLLFLLQKNKRLKRSQVEFAMACMQNGVTQHQQIALTWIEAQSRPDKHVHSLAKLSGPFQEDTGTPVKSPLVRHNRVDQAAAGTPRTYFHTCWSAQIKRGMASRWKSA